MVGPQLCRNVMHYVIQGVCQVYILLFPSPRPIFAVKLFSGGISASNNSITNEVVCTFQVIDYPQRKPERNLTAHCQEAENFPS
jgi:hypothetical protein